jgi:coenzyme Q-binding protein COQ10
MFALVADVERYPEFVPLCEGLKVRQRERTAECEVIVADMTVAYKFIRERFTSRVELRPGTQTILVNYLDGPFQHLENRWVFEPVRNAACRVHFYLDYEFRSRTLQMLMGAVFDRAFRKFAGAFEARADLIYAASRVPADPLAPSTA